MALNRQTLKTRALTALIFVAVMAAGLFLHPAGFVALFVIVHFGCWYEWIKLLKIIYPGKWLPYSFLGLLYITLPVLLLIEMRLGYLSVTADTVDYSKYLVLPCLIIFSMWVNDTMAYIVGSLIGKTPFSKISPKKTWEGTIGGILLCTLAMGLAGSCWGRGLFSNPVHYYAAAAIAAITGTAGDLLESKVKRMAGVKDSGTLMPGHGGFLDRFDSLLVAVPFVWLYAALVNN